VPYSLPRLRRRQPFVVDIYARDSHITALFREIDTQQELPVG